MSVSYSTISLKKGRRLWHSLESQTSITSNTFRLQTSLIITACCFVISFHSSKKTIYQRRPSASQRQELLGTTLTIYYTCKPPVIELGVNQNKCKCLPSFNHRVNFCYSFQEHLSISRKITTIILFTPPVSLYKSNQNNLPFLNNNKNHSKGVTSKKKLYLI